ncbi:hypothetical protein ACE4Z5_24580, partial [Salmonella enterica]|uniref:hypothetical protein n=1 Tax=Salmonella enterica TaxID=28901 RepID=UPI003D2DE905
MARFIHFDEARLVAVAALRDWIASVENVEATLITDLFGKMRLLLRPDGDAEMLSETLKQECGPWWTGECLRFEKLDASSRKIFDDAQQNAK